MAYSQEGLPGRPTARLEDKHLDAFEKVRITRTHKAPRQLPRRGGRGAPTKVFIAKRIPPFSFRGSIYRVCPLCSRTINPSSCPKAAFRLPNLVYNKVEEVAFRISFSARPTTGSPSYCRDVRTMCSTRHSVGRASNERALGHCRLPQEGHG